MYIWFRTEDLLVYLSTCSNVHSMVYEISGWQGLMIMLYDFNTRNLSGRDRPAMISLWLIRVTSRSLRFTIKMASDTLVNANLRLKDDLATIMEKVNPLFFLCLVQKRSSLCILKTANMCTYRSTNRQKVVKKGIWWRDVMDIWHTQDRLQVWCSQIVSWSSEHHSN